MLINGEDLVSSIKLAFTFLEVSPKLRAKVIDYLTACGNGEYDEEGVFHKMTKYTKGLFYEPDIEKGYRLIITGIKQAVGEQVSDPGEVKLE